jgi:TM2 domain-containing membrane protein YozV
MALTETQKRKIEEEERYRKEVVVNNQKHGVPALLSLFIPGMGQMVKGQVGKGIFILICTIIGYFCLVIPGLILHIWQIADAYNN